MDFSQVSEWAEQYSITQIELLDNSLQRWLIAIAVAIVAFILLRVVMSFIEHRVTRFTQRSQRGWDDGIAETMKATRNSFLFLVAIFIGSLSLDLPLQAEQVVQTIAVLALLLQAALWASRLMKFSIEYYMRQRRDSDPALATTVSAMSFVANLVLWSIVLLVALDNLGVDVTALVAGLGVGGIAVALAAQNILGDLFASLSIVLDKPFVLGDFIIVGDKMGTVENVGLKTTRLRALSGEQLVFANTDLLQSRIQNFKRMQERRCVFAIGVTYETPQEKVAAISGILREVVESKEHVRFDRAHFKNFGDFSLNFETVYYVDQPDYALFMDVQQAINLELMQRFESLNIEFAYPTQKLFMAKAES